MHVVLILFFAKVNTFTYLVAVNNPN